MALIGPTPIPQYFSDTGAVLAGGKLYYYTVGTENTKTVYKNAGMTTSWTQPIVLDADGRPSNPIFLDGIYDVKLTDSSNVTVWTVSNYGDNFTAVATDLNENKITNNSFDVDAGADGNPDNWTIAAATNGTVARDTTTVDHGSASLKFVRTDANGAGTATSAFYPVSVLQNETLAFSVKSSVANVRNLVQIQWFDKTQSSISTSTLYDNSTTNATSAFERIGPLTVTPVANATYAKLIIKGAEASGANGTVYFDNISGATATNTISPWGTRGLIMTRDAGDTDHDINVTSGEVRDASNVDNIIIASARIKQADAAWAAGSAAGGMFTGSALAVSTLYSVWVIKNPSTGAQDIGFDQSFTSPTLPSGYTLKRRIGAFLTDASSNIRAFIQSGPYFRLVSPFNDVNDSTITHNTFEIATLSCPPNALAHITGRAYNDGATNTANPYIRTKGAEDPASTEYSWVTASNGAVGCSAQGNGFVLVDAERKVEYAAHESGGTSIVSIIIHGWYDIGRDAP